MFYARDDFKGEGHNTSYPEYPPKSIDMPSVQDTQCQRDRTTDVENHLYAIVKKISFVVFK